MKTINTYIIEKLKINKHSKNIGKYNANEYEYKITDICLNEYFEWFLGQDGLIDIDDNFISDILYNSNLIEVFYDNPDLDYMDLSDDEIERIKKVLNDNLDEDIIVYQRKTNGGIENLLDVPFTEKEVYFYSTDYFDKKGCKIEKL